MSLLRLVIVWLLVAALPLQGIAAASMLYCGQAAHSAASQQGDHDHASHDHDHAGNSHGGDGHLGHADVKPSQFSDQGDKAAGVVDDGHSCPICASCCNLVAVSETSTLMLDAAPPASQPAQDASRVFTRDAPLPDKPP